MATRSKQFFMTFKEFSRWLRETSKALSLSVVTMRQRGEVLEYWHEGDGELEAASRVFLAVDDPAIKEIDGRNLELGRLGWVQLDIPRESEGELLLCQIATRSDWFDRSDSTIHDNPPVLKLYDKIWKRLRAALAFPVWVANEVTGGAAPYDSIGYSEGAAGLFRRGCRLRQAGAANLRFEIR